MVDLAFSTYETTILSLGVLAALMLLQLILADIIGIKSKQVPGTPVTSDHNNLLFRFSRTVANTNESIAIFLLLVLFCILSGANADFTGYLSSGFVGARMAYAVCYYSNQQILRSVTFGVSVIMLLGLLVTGFFT